MDATMEPVIVKVEVTEEDMEEDSSRHDQNYSVNRHLDQVGEGKVVKKRKPAGGRPRKTESEKKQKQRERFHRFKAKQVNLGDQVERWAMVKCLTEADSDRMLAKMLIDNYLEHHTGLQFGPQQGVACSGQTDTTKNLDTKTDKSKVKVEVTVGDSCREKSKVKTRRKVKTSEMKTEVDCDYSTESASNDDTEVDDVVGNTENEPNQSDDSQEGSQENSRSGGSKKRHFSDCISYIKEKQFKAAE